MVVRLSSSLFNLRYLVNGLNCSLISDCPFSCNEWIAFSYRSSAYQLLLTSLLPEPENVRSFLSISDSSFFFIACISVVLTTCSMQFIINPIVRAVGFPKSPAQIRDMKCPGKAIWIYGMAAVWGNNRLSYIGGQILNDKLSASAILSCSARVEAHILLKRMKGPIHSSIKTKHKSQLLAWNREGKRKNLQAFT